MFSSTIAIYTLFHKYYPRRAVFAWSPFMNFFLHLDFSRITATYKTDLLCCLLACLASLCNLFCRHVHGLKVTNSAILVMGSNIILKWKLTFVQTSCFIDVISDNDSKRVRKTFLFLQTCTTREYDWIKMLVLTDVFFESALYKMDCLLLTSKQDVG